MYPTPNMILTVWDQDEDDFDKVQLGANWNKVDIHDHSPGHGVQIGSAGIAANAIGPAQLAPNSVTESAIADNSVDTDDIQDGAITGAKLAPGAANSGLSPGGITYGELDPTIIPLGTVYMWWRPAGSSATPSNGWEIMDGRPWNTIPNALGSAGSQLTTGNIPDMRSKFAMGSDPSGIGVASGSNTINLAHAHTVNAHTHTGPVHVHGIQNDGAHSHTFVGGRHVWSRPNAFGEGTTVVDFANHQRQNVYESLFIAGFNDYFVDPGVTDIQADMDSAGVHNHGGVTDINGNGPTGTASPGTDTQLSNQSIAPSNIALLFIMRVR